MSRNLNVFVAIFGLTLISLVHSEPDGANAPPRADTPVPPAGVNPYAAYLPLLNGLGLGGLGGGSGAGAATYSSSAPGPPPLDGTGPVPPVGGPGLGGQGFGGPGFGGPGFGGPGGFANYLPATWLGSALGAKGDILFPCVIVVFFVVGIWTVINFLLAIVVPLIAAKIGKVKAAGTMMAAKKYRSTEDDTYQEQIDLADKVMQAIQKFQSAHNQTIDGVNIKHES